MYSDDEVIELPAPKPDMNIELVSLVSPKKLPVEDLEMEGKENYKVMKTNPLNFLLKLRDM